MASLSRVFISPERSASNALPLPPLNKKEVEVKNAFQEEGAL